jgi:CRISPR-associated protein Csb3
MSDMNQIEIRCNPSNPVNYLACCGIFDLVSRVDTGALGHWQPLGDARFVLETSVSDKELAATLVEALSNKDRWRLITSGESKELSRVEVTFQPPYHLAFLVCVDWWYETLKPDGRIDHKSSWKMYAGNQTVKQILEQRLIPGCLALHKAGKVSSVQSLLDASYPVEGRFGFDPRSSRNALNVGYSPNDLQMPIPTYPFAELLAVFGAASFFPQRLGEAGSLESTRGWSIGPPAAFVYGLWVDPLPIALARIAASHSSSPRDVRLFSERAYRKNYSNLTLAKPTTIEGGTP